MTGSKWKKKSRVWGSHKPLPQTKILTYFIDEPDKTKIIKTKQKNRTFLAEGSWLPGPVQRCPTTTTSSILRYKDTSKHQEYCTLTVPASGV